MAISIRLFHSVPRAPLDLLMWLGSRSAAESDDDTDEELTSISAVLDCLIQSTV